MVLGATHSLISLRRFGLIVPFVLLVALPILLLTIRAFPLDVTLFTASTAGNVVVVLPLPLSKHIVPSKEQVNEQG